MKYNMNVCVGYEEKISKAQRPHVKLKCSLCSFLHIEEQIRQAVYLKLSMHLKVCKCA